jgi:hypothetical protein
LHQTAAIPALPIIAQELRRLRQHTASSSELSFQLRKMYRSCGAHKGELPGLSLHALRYGGTALLSKSSGLLLQCIAAGRPQHLIRHPVVSLRKYIVFWVGASGAATACSTVL